MPSSQPADAPGDPGELIGIADDGSRFSAWYYEWNDERRECCADGHLTRRDALECAEARLRYRSLRATSSG